MDEVFSASIILQKWHTATLTQTNEAISESWISCSKRQGKIQLTLHNNELLKVEFNIYQVDDTLNQTFSVTALSFDDVSTHLIFIDDCKCVSFISRADSILYNILM